MTYPAFVKEIALEIYEQGKSYYDVATLLGEITPQTVNLWGREEGISRPRGETLRNCKGDDIKYAAQHYRAVKDFPYPLGLCQICENAPATERARIDHTNLSYRKEYVLLMCRSCNMKHNLCVEGDRIDGGFVILFKEVI